MAFAGLDELPIGYAQYASTTQVLLGIFVASQAPVLFSRDLRHGTISLYLARPLRSSTYALSRWVVAARRDPGLPAAAPRHPLRRGAARRARRRRADPPGRHRARRSPCCSPCRSPGSPGSSRRGRPAAASPWWPPSPCSSSPTASSPPSRASPARRASREVGEVAGLFSPYSLYRGLMGAWTDADTPDAADVDRDGARLRRRLRRPLGGLPRRAGVALPAGGDRMSVLTLDQTSRWYGNVVAVNGISMTVRPGRDRPARPQRRRQDDDHRPDVRLPRPVGGHRHPRR